MKWYVKLNYCLYYNRVVTASWSIVLSWLYFQQYFTMVAYFPEVICRLAEQRRSVASSAACCTADAMYRTEHTAPIALYMTILMNELPVVASTAYRHFVDSSPLTSLRWPCTAAVRHSQPHNPSREVDTLDLLLVHLRYYCCIQQAAAVHPA